MKKTYKKSIKSFAFCSLSITCASAATISWTAPTPALLEADVLTTGTTHTAVNASVNGAADITLNGITFESGNVNAATNVTAPGSFTGSNPSNLNPNAVGDTLAYQTFLGDLDFNGANPGIININNLTPGDQYIVQVWFFDNRVNTDGRVTTVSDGAGSSVSLNDQFSVGSFTAMGTTQTIDVATSGSSPQFTGFQVRNVTEVVPEPTSAALLGLGGLALLARRRR